MEPVVSNGMSVGELKGEIIDELKKSYKIEETPERFLLAHFIITASNINQVIYILTKLLTISILNPG